MNSQPTSDFHWISLQIAGINPMQCPATAIALMIVCEHCWMDPERKANWSSKLSIDEAVRKTMLQR
jgi:hypothetical protein